MANRLQRVEGPLFLNKGPGLAGGARALAQEPYYTHLERAQPWYMDTRMYIACLWELLGTMFITLTAGIVLRMADRNGTPITLLTGVLVAAVVSVVYYALRYIRRNPWLPGHYNPGYTMFKLICGEIGFWDSLGYWVSQFAGAGVAFAILASTTSALLRLGGQVDANNVVDNYNAPFAGIPLGGAAGAFFLSMFGGFIIYFMTGQEANGDYSDMTTTRHRENVSNAATQFFVRATFILFGLVSFNPAVLMGLLLVGQLGVAAPVYATGNSVGTYFLFFGANMVAAIVAAFVSWVGGQVDGYLETEEVTNRRLRSDAADYNNRNARAMAKERVQGAMNNVAQSRRTRRQGTRTAY